MPHDNTMGAKTQSETRPLGSPVTVEAFKLLMGRGIEMDGMRFDPLPEPLPAVPP